MKPIMIRLETEPEILRTLSFCKDDFFDQNFAAPEMLQILSHKFAEHAIVLRAEIDGQIAGFVAFYANDTVSRTGFISMIIVRQAFQGRGVGGQLLQETVALLCRNDFHTLRLEVRKDNASAIRFYTRKGFFQEGETSKDSVYYRLSLSQSKECL